MNIAETQEAEEITSFKGDSRFKSDDYMNDKDNIYRNEPTDKQTEPSTVEGITQDLTEMVSEESQENNDISEASDLTKGPKDLTGNSKANGVIITANQANGHLKPFDHDSDLDIENKVNYFRHRDSCTHHMVYGNMLNPTHLTGSHEDIVSTDEEDFGSKDERKANGMTRFADNPTFIDDEGNSPRTIRKRQAVVSFVVTDTENQTQEKRHETKEKQRVKDMV